MHISREEIHLRDYWEIISKQRNIVLAIFSAVVGLVTIYSFIATPIYEGTASLLVDVEKNPSMTFVEGAGYVPVEKTKEYLQTHIGIFQTRAFADRVVRKLQLDKNSYFLEKKDKKKNNLFSLAGNWIKDTVNRLFPQKSPPLPALPELSVKELDPDLTDIIMEDMYMDAGKENNILTIRYRADDPNVSAFMSNGIAQSYIEHKLEIIIKPYRDAVEWLSARLTESKSRVEGSEKTLQSYKENTGIVSFDEKQNVITQKLQELVSQLVQAEGKRQEADARYNQIKAVIDKPERMETLPEIMSNLVIQGIKNEELRLKNKLSELSEKYGPKHPEILKTKKELEEVQKNFFIETRKMLNAAKTEYEIARARESSIRMAVEEQKRTVMELGKKAIDFSVISGEAESNRQFYEILLKKLQEATLSGGITLSNVQIVDWAMPEESPVRPKRLLYILMSILVGLFVGVGFAIFVEYLDDTVKTSDDVETSLQLPFLGLVPSADRKDKKEKTEKPMVYLLSSPKSMISEAYKGIRTSIVLSVADKELKVILIASAEPDDGKTTTVANLSAAMAQMGENVLIIDSDMRKGKLHQTFGIDAAAKGLSNIIAEKYDVSAAIRKVDGIPNLDIITAGSFPPNPSGMLTSMQMKDLIKDLRGKYDRIILDSPPLLAVSDALTLSALSDGVVLVVHGGVATRDTIMRCKKLLEGVKANITGVVINNISMNKTDYYYYPYYEHYTEGAGSND